MDDNKELILDTNKRFYEALSKADIRLMESVWVNDTRAKCVHPGWPLLKGWETIKKSWEDIFAAGGISGVRISDINLRLKEGVCWVTCIEHVSHVIKDTIAVNLIQATNLYEMDGNSRCNLILHHASAIPITRGYRNDQTLQ